MFTRLRNFLHDQPPYLPQCSGLCSVKRHLWILTLVPGTLVGQTIRHLVFPWGDFPCIIPLHCDSSMPPGISLPSSPGSWFRAPYLTQATVSVWTCPPDSKWIAGDLGIEVSNGMEQTGKMEMRMLSGFKVGILPSEQIRLKSGCDSRGR